MTKQTQTRLEWGMLAIIAVAGLGLSYLQYRWTGDLSRAESSRLRGSVERQLRQIVQAFDAEIRQQCRELLPTASEIRGEGRAAAHRARFERWAAARQSSHMFGRIAVAIPANNALTLSLLDAKGELSPASWPAEWEPMRRAIQARVEGSRPPIFALNGSDLIESPVFDDQEQEHGPAEIEWMLFEPSRDYIRQQLLPGYIGEYLNIGTEQEFEVSVSRAGNDADVIFSTRRDGASVLKSPDLTTGLFSSEPPFLEGRSGKGRRPDEDGRPGRERRGERGGRGGGSPRWMLAIRHRAGSLDAAVNQARTRNLLASLLLIGLLAGTAWLLVRFTARSRRLSDMQFRFAAGVSHDLRTPLTAIRGAAFNLVNGLVKDQAAVERYARLILRNAEELSAMVENVMAYTSAQQADVRPLREPVDLKAVLEQAAASMQSEIQEAGCHLELTIAPNLPPLHGDALAIEQAFRNLIGNAVRHAAQGKWIGVSAAAHNGSIAVRVCDRGPGIPANEQARIFEPFFRGEQTRRNRIRGAGLGLSLVQTTVQRHGGKITVQSTPAQGTEFHVWLPGAEITA